MEKKTKICYKCGVEKSISEFHKDKGRQDGIQLKCKKCMKQYYQEHKVFIKNRANQHYYTNKPAIAIWRKGYRQKHKEEIAIQLKKYRQTNQGKAAIYRAIYKRRALKANVEYETFNTKEILERDGYICQRCRRKTRPDFKDTTHPLYPNLDHIIPLSLGGEHTRKNTQCLCHQCNLEKFNSGKGDQLRMFG